jgi:hypothetical protein
MSSTLTVDAVTKALGEKRAAQVERQRPGAIGAAVYAVGALAEEPVTSKVPLAVVRALQLAGSKPTVDDEIALAQARGRALTPVQQAYLDKAAAKKKPKKGVEEEPEAVTEGAEATVAKLEEPTTE